MNQYWLDLDASELDASDEDAYEFHRELRAVQATCMHSWVAGMMNVHDEDLDFVAKKRKVECEKCEKVYNPKESDPWYINN